MASRAFTLHRSLSLCRSNNSVFSRSSFRALSTVRKPLVARELPRRPFRGKDGEAVYAPFRRKLAISFNNKSELPGCDYEHFLVITKGLENGLWRNEIINAYIQIVAKIVGSKQEARMRIYSVSTKPKDFLVFGAHLPEELAQHLTSLAGVKFMLADSYWNIEKKDYGGEPFINGQAVPCDPGYNHDAWVESRKGWKTAAERVYNMLQAFSQEDHQG